MTSLPPPGSRYVVRDAQVLRALAHPLRTRLLGLLRTDGPSTATLLGRAVGESSGTTSYHLRELERYGFVEEVAGRGTGRERWWQALHRFTSWDRASLGEAGDAADVLEDQMLEHRARCYATWQAERPDREPEWQEAATYNDVALRLTPQDARAFAQELGELMLRWGDRSAAPGTPGVGHVVAFADLLPLRHRPQFGAAREAST